MSTVTQRIEGEVVQGNFPPLPPPPPPNWVADQLRPAMELPWHWIGDMLWAHQEAPPKDDESWAPWHDEAIGVLCVEDFIDFPELPQHIAALHNALFPQHQTEAEAVSFAASGDSLISRESEA